MNALADIWHNLSSGNAEHREQISGLAEILEIPERQVRDIPHDRKLGYRTYEIRKRSGKPRRIDEPCGKLKQLQRRLACNYLDPFNKQSDFSWSFRRGESIASHAQCHTGKAIVLTVDIADFFPSISRRRIREWFRSQQWNGLALDCLTRLTTYRGSLPQGAPTSPMLSNIVNQKLDWGLMGLVAPTGGYYSRYCDDLAFSWPVDEEPRSIRVQVEERLRREGYRINREKGWQLQRAKDHPELTGIAIHGRRLRPSRANRKKIREALRNPETTSQQIAGYRGFLRMLRGKRWFG